MINKPLAIAYKPFKSMKTNTSKEKSFYTQGQRFAARVLFILWLLASGSPEGALATPKRQMVPATTTSPGEPSLASALPTPALGGALELLPEAPGSLRDDSVASSPAIDAAFQQRMSQEAIPFTERDLLRTFPKVSPVEEHLPFQARGGESVRFHYQMGQWHAEVSSQIGAFSRRAVLPVVCSQGEDVASSLEVLSRYPRWYSQRQIHVLDRSVCPTLGEVVYVGELGLKGGGEGEASGSGEPQGEDPAEQGDGEQTEQAVSLQTPSPADQPATTATTPLRTSSSANQIEAKKLKEQIDQLYPKLSEATPEGYSQIVDGLLTHLVCLLDLEQWIGAQESNSAQDYIVRLREVHATRWGVTAYGLVDKQLTVLLERAYVQALKVANSDLLLTKTLAGTTKLAKSLGQLAVLDQEQGDKTIDLSHYTDAAILYQHILSICAKEQNTLGSQGAATLQNAAYQGLAQLQTSMLAQAIGADAAATTPEDVASLQERISEDRNELEAFRADVRPRTTALINSLEDVLSNPERSAEAIKQAEEAYIQGSQALFGEIAQWMGEFLARLYRESEAALGPAPCKYAVMGLGSMALQQITPYSDLEFAILIEDAKNEAQEARWKEYFRKLTHLVHLRVINLGETVFPKHQYGVSLDHLGKRGLNFDLGGKTPLGRKDKPHLKKPYELIQPVSGMVYYLHNEEDKMEHMDKLLPYILESTCYVHGDSSLHERYVTEKRAFLLESLDDSGNPAYQKRALKKLVEGVVEMDYRNPEQDKPGRRQVGDLEDFEPKFGMEDAGRLYDVKQEIYRLPDRLLYRLAMYYGMLPMSGWDAVVQLAASGIIHPSAVHYLHYTVSFATMLRLHTYVHYGQQSERLSMLGSATQMEASQTVQEIFSLPEIALQEDGSLFKYYYTALPLYKTMKDSFGEGGSVADSRGAGFFQEAFYDDSNEAKGDVHRRLLRDETAKACYERALGIKEQAYEQNHLSIAFTLSNLGNIQIALGDARQAISYYERSLKIKEQVYGHNHPSIASILMGLGAACRDLGDARQAVSYYERSLNIFRQAYEQNHPRIALILNNLGIACRDLGDIRQAVSYHERSLNIFEQIYEQNHPRIALTLDNLGAACRDLGDIRQAVSYHKRSLNIYAQICEQNHPLIAQTLNNLGNAWRDLGDMHQAVACYKRSLSICKQIYEQNHPRIAQTLSNLGNAWRDLRDVHQAVACYKRSLSICKQIYEQNHPRIAQTLSNLGNAWRDLRDVHQAVACYKRSLSICKQIYEQNHPLIAQTLSSLGSAWRDLGDMRQAVACYEGTLHIREQVYEQNHPRIAQILNNIGDAWLDLGDSRKAVFYLERSLGIYEHVYKKQPVHPDIARILNNLGLAWGGLGNPRKGISYLERSLAIKEQLYDPNHPFIAATLNNLGKAWGGLGDVRKAMIYYGRSLAIKEQVYQADPNHPDIARTLNNLGNAWVGLKDPRQAVPYLERALAIFEQVHQADPNHPNIANTLNSLGNAWGALGDAREATPYLERALAIYRQVYQADPNHPDIARTLNNLGHAWSALGDFRKAVSYYERALTVKEQVCKEAPNHPEIAATLNNLGAVWSALGEARKALSYYQRALAIYEQVYDANHPYVVGTLHNLGCMYHVAALAARQEGDEQDTQAYLEKASTSFEQAVQASDAVKVGLYTEYGNFLLDTRKAAQAYDYLHQAIESGDDASGLSYSLLEQPTVTPVLQAYISQQQKVSLRGIDYAYYLMIHHYEDFQKAGIEMAQTREDYLAAYQASIDQCSGRPGQEKKDKTAYHLLGSLYKVQGDHEAAAAFARAQDGTEQEDTQAAA